MVFNTVLIASVATISADIWQSVACISDRITNQELLDLVICFPLQQLGRFAIVFWNFFCAPPAPPEHYAYSYSYYDDTDYDDDSDVGYGHGRRVSYSDSHSE
nr:serine/threonine-protein kinase pats1 [Tanacetum cinerariifolium]